MGRAFFWFRTFETKELPEFAHLRAYVYRLIKRDRSAPSGVDAPSTLVGEGLLD